MTRVDMTKVRELARNQPHKDGSDQTDYHGRCLGFCRECGEHLESTGRYTPYCPSCDTCPDCGCPNADGFAHYANCPRLTDCQGCGETMDEDSLHAGFCWPCEQKSFEDEEEQPKGKVVDPTIYDPEWDDPKVQEDWNRFVGADQRN